MAARDVITFGFSGAGAFTIPMLGFSGGDSPAAPAAIVHQGGIGLLDPDRKLAWDMLLERARRKRDEEEIVIL